MGGEGHVRMDGLVLAAAVVAALGTLALQGASQSLRLSEATAQDLAITAPQPDAPAAGLAPSAPLAESPVSRPVPRARAGTRIVIKQARVAPPLPPPPTFTSRRSSDNRSRNSGRRTRQPTRAPTPSSWTPPDGPVRIALQAGHWRANEAPRELSGLKGNGTAFRGTAEWETNLDIARRAATQLRRLGYEVDVLPAVIPPGYRAHLFIAIHADGSNDPNASGFRVAAPRRDPTGRASEIVRLLEQSYGEATGIKHLSTVTRRMQNYYAFNYRRYEHSLDPRTISAILETGFLTSSKDRRIIMNDPERAARGIVQAIAAFSETPPPLRASPETRSGRE